MSDLVDHLRFEVVNMTYEQNYRRLGEYGVAGSGRYEPRILGYYAMPAAARRGPGSARERATRLVWDPVQEGFWREGASGLEFITSESAAGVRFVAAFELL